MEEANKYKCPTCCDTGFIHVDEDDGEGHMQSGVGTARCPDCNLEKESE